jgi:N-acetyl-anhydromuramyl-L-alanine amidase AmpD
MAEIKEIVIHCSASPNGRDDRAEDIHRWHLERGFDGIGYHWVITRGGRLEAGRPEYWTGAHAKGHNTGSIGICLIGTDEFTDKQFMELKCLLIRLRNRYPDAIILGHNEISEKSCPGFDVQEWLRKNNVCRNS